jgi:hypothetical protein
MTILIKSALDTTGVNQGVSQAQNQLKTELGGALQNVEQKAKSAEKSLSSMLQLQKLESFAGKFGDIKDIVEKAGTAVFGLSQQTVKTTASMADLAQKGVSLGASFGPWGALIGGAAGALVGFVAAADDSAAALARVQWAAEESKRAADEFLRSWEEAQAIKAHIDDVAKSADALQLSIKNALNPAELPKSAEGLAKATNKVKSALEGTLLISKLAEGQLKALQDTVDDVSFRYAASTEDQAQKAKDLEAAKDTLARKEEYIAELTERGQTQISELNTLTAEQTRRTQASTSAINHQTKALKDAEAASRARVAAIEAETRAFLERSAASEEARAERLATGEGLDVEGMREGMDELNAASLEVFNNLSLLPEIEIPALPFEEMGAALSAASEGAKQLGEDLQHALVEVGVGAATKLFDNIEAGRKPLAGLGKAFGQLASQQLKAIGTGLIGEGIANELKAAAILITSLGVNPQGYALAAVGAAEIGLGLAMGAGGALLGRRSGGAAAAVPTSTGTSESLGSRETEASGPQRLSDVKIYLGPEQGMAVFAGDQRGISEYGKFTTTAQQIASKAPR